MFCAVLLFGIVVIIAVVVTDVVVVVVSPHKLGFPMFSRADLFCE